MPEIYHETIKKGVMAWNEARPFSLATTGTGGGWFWGRIVSVGLRCWRQQPQETIPVRDVNGSGEPLLHCVAPGDVDYPAP